MKQILGALLGGAAVAGAAGYWLRRSLPRHRGTVRLGGIDSEIEIVRDRWSIPHIFAASTSDLFFGQGYATAQDRLWQMEAGRRIASGTLAELVGPAVLDADRLLRRLGFRRAAQAEWHDLAAEGQQALVNYAVFREGFDAPKTRAIIVARPVYSPNLYFQMIGRGLRGEKNGGNDRCLILNVEDNIVNFEGKLAFSDLDWLWA